MSHAWDAMESILLDELASTIDLLQRTDLQIRQHVEAGRWGEARRQSAALMDWLKQKCLDGEAVRQQLIELTDVEVGDQAQKVRCRDMTSHLLGVASRYLPIYQRMAGGPDERQRVGPASPD
jgi:hypothetical protein